MVDPVFTSYFCAPISIYRILAKFDTIRIEACENYQKRSFRNKAIVCGSDGPKILTVPLKKGKSNQSPIRDTAISYDEDWISNIIKTLRAYYGKAPYFEEIIEDIQDLLNQKHTTLYNLNKEILIWSLEFLQIETQILDTESFVPTYTDNDYRNIPHLKQYAEQQELKTYTQLFSDRLPFQPNLSILDLLFCQGPEAIFYLRYN